MASSLSPSRFGALFLLFILNFCFASSLELPSLLKRSQHREVSQVKRAVGKTFEIPFEITTYGSEIYGFNCSIGTPPQNVRVGISVFKSDTQLSLNITQNPWNTTFNVTASTSAKFSLEMVAPNGALSGLYTYTPNSDLYNIDYTDITYATDDFQIPGRDGLATLGDVPFVAYTNTTGTGNYSIAGIDDFDYQWIGLGLATGQAIVYSPYTDGKPWPTFAQHFMNASLIESNTYSIWLDSPSQKTGHLLLGGLNSKRYKGSLVNLPTSLNVTSTQYGLKLQSVLSVGIESFSANGKVIPNTTVQNAILAHDSSTYLPPEVALEIWDAVGAIYDPNSGNLDKLEPQVPCSYLTNASTISLTFTGSNLTLPIPMSAITVKGGNGPLRDSGPYADTCQILIRYVRLGLPAMLGSNVLRELYTVYDFENKAISVALTDFDAKEDNVIAIPVGGVAGIKKEAFGNDTASGNGTSSDPNATTEGQIPVDRETTVPDSGSGNGVAIGVGVAVPIVVIAGLAAAFFLWRRRKAAKDKALAKGDGNDGNEVHAKAELADDQKPHAEAMGNEVFEVGDDGTYKHELESPEARKQELAAEQRHELA